MAKLIERHWQKNTLYKIRMKEKAKDGTVISYYERNKT